MICLCHRGTVSFSDCSSQAVLDSCRWHSFFVCAPLSFIANFHFLLNCRNKTNVPFKTAKQFRLWAKIAETHHKPFEFF